MSHSAPNRRAQWPLDLRHSSAFIGCPLSDRKIQPSPRGVGCALGLTSRSPVATDGRGGGLGRILQARTPLCGPQRPLPLSAQPGASLGSRTAAVGRVCHWRRRRLRRQLITASAPSRAAAGVDKPTLLAARCPKPPVLECCLCSWSPSRTTPPPPPHATTSHSAPPARIDDPPSPLA